MINRPQVIVGKRITVIAALFTFLFLSCKKCLLHYVYNNLLPSNLIVLVNGTLSGVYIHQLFMVWHKYQVNF